MVSKVQLDAISESFLAPSYLDSLANESIYSLFEWFVVGDE
jgi:hypothetical protein